MEARVMDWVGGPGADGILVVCSLSFYFLRAARVKVDKWAGCVFVFCFCLVAAGRKSGSKYTGSIYVSFSSVHLSIQFTLSRESESSNHGLSR